MGVLLIGIGVYAVFDKWRSGEGFRLENVYDVIFNLAFILVIIGFIVAVVSCTFDSFATVHCRKMILFDAYLVQICPF